MPGPVPRGKVTSAPNSRLRRSGASGVGGRRQGAHATTASANVSAPARSQGSIGCFCRRAVSPGADSRRPASGRASRSSIAMRASPMSRSRRAGSRSRQRFNSAVRAAGVSAGSASQETSWRTTAASMSVTVSPVKRRWPVSSSWTRTPNDQMSARLSTDRPRACSGLM
jgi:hypothetical protein